MGITAIQRSIRSSAVRCLLSGFVLSSLISGCTSSSSSQVYVEDRTSSTNAAQRRQPVTSGQYRVQRGDTLYSIAFRYGWDWKALAARNKISPPYVIRVGQVIRFDGQPATSSVASAAQATRTSPSSSGSASRSSTVVLTRPATTQSRPAAQTSAAVSSLPATEKSPSGWIWPTNGQVIGRFSSNGSLNKGIDISGELGQPVLAASDGSVVYAGSGLRGYGELVIIKHSDTYVSAYGHNRRLLVQEGQKVKAGQKIAEMGSTGTDRVKLHFEVRRQGKPVDPLQYLPRR
ncbi:peptidoglycan DD-metalloendopeptidase family protein [Pseudomonas sp. TTU2014-080ASC]|uniref:peptidoglycan DD-metalloendopeptidase family protein n=1 Tax=Pseudomonas sp. TTU2014-080ASC TaxID=1729724 RepID=UPI0009E6AC46|nr:peptidoglycan DD-metalloendopeptidase family protein [Pseudomonas sp. TTU2014-080ASC]